MAKRRTKISVRRGDAATSLPKEPPTPSPAEHLPQEPAFPIVGIGASAGGLEAFTRLLQCLPPDPGMALVLVQHLDPSYDSMLTELLSRVSKMPVRQVRDGMGIEPDHVYVIPPNVTMTMTDTSFKLLPRTLARGMHMPVDSFFRSLANSRGSHAIGVILSGNASDGALGLEAVKGEGGITFVQDDRTAKFAGMPRNAIATGSADFVLPVEGIADELVRIGRHPYVQRPPPVPAGVFPEDSENALRSVLRLLQRATEVDFSLYKPTTVRRRIMRRMTLLKIDRLPDYLKFLKERPEEIEALYGDILIKVTSFFRDPKFLRPSSERRFRLFSNTIRPENRSGSGSPVAPPEKKFTPSQSACWSSWATGPPASRCNSLPLTYTRRPWPKPAAANT